MSSFLIVNSDETGLKLIPQSEWTMENEGATESTHESWGDLVILGTREGLLRISQI